MKKSLFIALLLVSTMASSVVVAAGCQPTKGSNSSKGCSGCTKGGCCR